jgi:NAD+ synthase
LSFLPQLDYDNEIKRITQFIKKVIDESNVKGVVLGLSGGIDSTVAALLCHKALGPRRVLGLIMPASFTPQEDVEDSLQLAKQSEFEFKRIDIDPIVKQFIKYTDNEESKTVLGNLRARVRMLYNYYYANMRKFLVCGTGNRSEYLLGYFTKFGDGAADFYPILHLYKSEVRELGRRLGLSNRVAYKPASPQLWPGHKATDELPADYTILDPILHGLFSLGLDSKNIEDKIDNSGDIIGEVLNLYEQSKHKRISAPALQRLNKK